MRVILGAALLAAVAVPVPAPAATFDGAWHVTIITERGDCDRAYGYGVDVFGGRVRYTGEAAINVNGTVSPSGAVKVTVSRGDQRADGTGKLSGSSGTGTWRGESTTGSCAGRWEAERRS